MEVVDSSNNGDVVIETEVPDLQTTLVVIPKCDESVKPRIGMRFVSMEEGIRFYKAYAKECGFDAKCSTLKSRSDKSSYIRYVLCSREGKKTQPEGGNNHTRKRRRSSCRIECLARLAMKAVGFAGFVTYKFVEGHNHTMLPNGYRKYMKANRRLDAGQQLFLAKCAIANVGALKCYRIYKQFAGAMKSDFKNMARDIKSYVVGIDSELLLEKFARVHAKDERFSYSYEKDEDTNLIRLFWADAAAVQNYQVFGDAVSFDATYHTNKYCMIFAPFTGQDNHGKCVNFGAGLLAREDTESYSWLLSKFVECMGSAPKIIITDQDLGMRAAIERVLPSTHHRFCMWHITRKLAEKISVSLRANDDFIKSFNDIVWSDADEPTVFESKWNNLIKEYSLEGNKWFTDMYALRAFWIPAFFRDKDMSVLFRTTSYSECENSFFRRYLNKNSNLSDMYILFEVAIEAQREDHELATLADKSTVPDMITRLEIEEYAAKVYTNKKFLDVQKEIEMSVMFCIVGESVNDGNCMTYDVEEDAVGIFKVSRNLIDEFITCQCLHFTRFALLCRHIFAVFKQLKYKKIPEKYIARRWSKEFCSVFDEMGQNAFASGLTAPKNPEKGLFALACKSIAIADRDEKLTPELSDLFERFSLSHSGDDASMSAAKYKKKVIECYYGSKVPESTSTGDPKMSKMKGSGSRLKSRFEAALEKAKKPERMCHSCKTMGHHDSRNCPDKMLVSD